MAQRASAAYPSTRHPASIRALRILGALTTAPARCLLTISVVLKSVARLF